MLVVELLRDGPMRFNEIRRTINGISQRMLTLTLRGLERDVLETRTLYPTIPPRVEYELTGLGRTLREPLGAIAEWARTHRPTIERAQRTFDAAPTGSKNVRRNPRLAPALVRAEHLRASTTKLWVVSKAREVFGVGQVVAVNRCPG